MDKSLSTIIFSARKGIPFKPSLVEISPSLINPPADKILSSACCIIKASDSPA